MPNKLSHFIAGLWLSSYNWVWVILQELFYNRFNIHLLSVQVKLFPDNFWRITLLFPDYHFEGRVFKKWIFFCELIDVKWKLPLLICRNQPDTVVSALDLDKVRQDMFYSLAIPVPCILLSVLYFVIVKYAEKIKKPRGVRGEQRMQSLSIFCVFIFLEMNFYSCSPTDQLHRLQWGVHWQQC